MIWQYFLLEPIHILLYKDTELFRKLCIFFSFRNIFVPDFPLLQRAAFPALSYIVVIKSDTFPNLHY